ncbi:hypothetical protein HK414_19830 [Ramlibacter terrae]|uniref:Uncharacterized protein n=1 Tax=Ramlibacter terrae TaxID=2732511 RepID=A0ABX6P4D3_9BURK|nr:hypothetical protein HK414_19830 [Ramlibacter terrae]
MATTDTTPERQQPFTLYAARGRLYASNAAQKLIDLGELSQQGDQWRYLLDGNKQAGSGFFTAEEALRDVGGKIRFLYLDGQFTAVADARDNPELDLANAARLDITLDALAPGEPATDATV